MELPDLGQECSGRGGETRLSCQRSRADILHPCDDNHHDKLDGKTNNSRELSAQDLGDRARKTSYDAKSAGVLST